MKLERIRGSLESIDNIPIPDVFREDVFSHIYKGGPYTMTSTHSKSSKQFYFEWYPTRRLVYFITTVIRWGSFIRKEGVDILKVNIPQKHNSIFELEDYTILENQLENQLDTFNLTLFNQTLFNLQCMAASLKINISEQNQILIDKCRQDMNKIATSLLDKHRNCAIAYPNEYLRLSNFFTNTEDFQSIYNQPSPQEKIRIAEHQKRLPNFNTCDHLIDMRDQHNSVGSEFGYGFGAPDYV